MIYTQNEKRPRGDVERRDFGGTESSGGENQSTPGERFKSDFSIVSSRRRSNAEIRFEHPKPFGKYVR